VLLLVGSGDNGGDALYAGARLAGRGAAVEALLVSGTAHQDGLAAFRDSGGRIVTAVPSRLDLVLDGITGIGGRGALRPEAARLAAAAALTGATVVAVDLPSGVDADTGSVSGEAVLADLTVTFGCYKPGLLVGAGAARSGLVELVDIGLAPYLPAPVFAAPELADVAGWWRSPVSGDDKYSRGVVGIVTGSGAYPGAAVLSTGSALHGPIGMVRYAGPAAPAVRAAHPEVVVTETVAEAGRVQAWAVGSGLGTSAEAAEVVRVVLATDLPVLVDADAITVLAEHPDWIRNRTAPTLLTPHDREFARLFGPVGEDRLGSAQDAAARFGVTVLLKGDRTVVAAPDGRAYLNSTGSPALATAGSGDVLTGLGGSLLASGLPALEAGSAAAFAHGLAGRLAAEDGPVSASGVLAALRPAIKRLKSGT
jgi:hydroxyethylthiazole kinase-like uncharacterized protein yjeF